MTIELSHALKVEDSNSYGRAPAVAFTGAAAGVIVGRTIHRAFGFSLGELTAKIMKGEEKIKPLSPKKRNELFALFRESKILIIDEIYAVDTTLLNIINLRLQHIFNNSNLFGGLAVLLVGDPRQIIPVAGRALFYINKFLPFPGDDNRTIDRKLLNVSNDKVKQGEIDGYDLYSRFNFHAP